MAIIDQSCQDFVQVLASKEPIPGGGGASALVGAVGMALGNMVASLTIGKKKYAAVEAEMIALQAKATALQQEFLRLVDADAEVFTPLAAAYRLPTGTEAEIEHKAVVMEEVLKTACQVPLEIMEACGEALKIIAILAKKGSVMAVSDAGVGAAFCRAALNGASLNVFINTKAMKDQDYARKCNEQADRCITEYTQLADKIFSEVNDQLRS